MRRFLTSDVKGEEFAAEVGISRRTLGNWTRELRHVIEAEGAIIVGQADRQKVESPYSEEFRRDIVRRYLNDEGSTYVLAEEIGVWQATVHRWVQDLRESVAAESAFAFFG